MQNPPPQRRSSPVLVLIGFAVPCSVILIMLMPGPLQSRQVSRIAQAFSDVRRLRDEHASKTSQETVQLSEADPWGTTYRLESNENQPVRVRSAGPDRMFEENGTESDDIYSEMPVSSMEPFRNRRAREWAQA